MIFILILNVLAPSLSGFPDLHIRYWSPEALSKLASGVGKPLYTDKFTAELEKISYARVLVEADVSQPLPECIEIDTPFGVSNNRSPIIGNQSFVLNA